MERYTEMCPCCIDCVEKQINSYYTDAPVHSGCGTLKDPSAQWSCVPSIGKNLQPFTGYGIDSII